jgi:uncharacterized membrane protein YraQ (UPF0718 family)
MGDLAPKILHELSGLGADLWEGVRHILWYFVAGCLLAAWIRTYKFHVRMRKQLPRLGFWAIFAAVGVGVISPLCACGVLPIMVSLLTAGMPLAPCMALLVASPLMSAEGYAVTAGLLGPAWANAKLVAAVFMGLWAGLVTHVAARRGFDVSEIFRGPVPQGDMHDHDCDPRIACNCPDRWSNRIARRHPNKFIVFWAKAAETAWKVGRYVALGLVVEVLGERYVPQDWIASVFASPRWYTTALVALVSAPLHVNQFTAAGILYGPLNVLEQMGKTISWGSGMAFLIGGPVTALPAMGVFLSLFKPRVFWLYLAICFSGTLIVAYTAQALLG